MPWLPLSYRKGQTKPYGSIPRINWAHPLAKDLVSYGYDAGGVVIDLATGKCGTQRGASLTRSSSRFGSGLKYPGGALLGAVELPASPLLVNGYSNGIFSFAAAWLMTADPSNSAVAPFGLGDASGANPFNFLLNNGSGAESVEWWFSDQEGVADVVMASGNTTNVFHTALAVATGTTAEIGYFDGVSKGTGANATVSTLHTDYFPMFNEGDTSGTNAHGNGFAGFIYYGAVWNRALTATEALQLHLDPYCFLVYPEDEIFAELVKAASGSLNVNLTGVAMTARAAVFAPLVSFNLPGASATSAVGSLTASISDTLAGASGTSVAGSLAKVVSVTVNGAAASSAAGILGTPGVAVTGAAAVSAAGTISPSVADTVAGAATTSAAGSFTPSVLDSLSSAAAASAAGNLGPLIPDTIPGAGAISAAGNLSPSISDALAGAAAIGAAGVFVPSILSALIGAQGTSSAGNLTPSSNFVIGAQGISAAGALTPSVSVTLPGALAATAAGAISGADSNGITGAGASTAAGTIGITAGALAGAAAQGLAGVLFSSIIVPTLPGATMTAQAGVLSATLPILIPNPEYILSYSSIPKRVLNYPKIPVRKLPLN